MTGPEDRSQTHLPLSDVRVIAVEQYGAGPWGTMMLAELGAEIIKIENPHTGGDVARYVPPYTAEQDSIYFQSFNRNKKSITLDLKHARAQEVFQPLVNSADAVFNNLRGDLPVKLGLDYTSLKELKPAIVCCSLSAFGRHSSRASLPGYDYLMQGYAGWMSLTGEPGTPPQKTGLSLVDLPGGTMAALGLISAILQARRTGVGCDVDVSLFDTALSHLGYVGAWHLSRGYEPKRMPDSAHPSQVPMQLLPTKDSWMVVMCAKEKFFRNLATIMGDAKLADDPRFVDFASRLENREALIPLLKELSVEKTTGDWLELMEGKVPVAPVNTVEEALRDPQVFEDEMIVETQHPQFGQVRQLASPIKISSSTIKHQRGPALGEHTEEVLTDLLGFSRAEIESLSADKVV